MKISAPVLFFLIPSLMMCAVLGCNLTSPSDGDAGKDVKELAIYAGIFFEEDAEFFNEVLTENDFIFTWGAGPFKLRLLGKIEVPRTCESVMSIPAIEEAFGQIELANMSIDCINYNPEQWGLSSGLNRTPREEIDDLSGAVRQARELAHQKGTILSFGTDYILLERYGEEIAPLVDQFGIQMQRYQRESLEEFRDQALKKIAIVRKGSKEVPVFIQVSMAPPKWQDGKKTYEPVDLEIVLEQIEAIKDLVDGIGFLYTEESRDEMKRLLRLLRP